MILKKTTSAFIARLYDIYAYLIYLLILLVSNTINDFYCICVEGDLAD